MHNLFDLDTFSRTDINRVMKTTQKFEQSRHRLKLKRLLICNLFFEPSTRTIASFEIAGKSLGANVLNITTTTSSVAKGESIIDTVKTLSVMGVNVFIIRSKDAGTPYLVERHTTAHIINAGDGDHAHPTQALADAYVLQKHLSGSAWGGLKQKNIVVVGDIAHSRVAKSNIWALSALGARITLVAPDYFLKPSPSRNEQWKNPFELPSVKYEPNLNRALKTADAVMALRIQKERLEKNNLLRKRIHQKLPNKRTADETNATPRNTPPPRTAKPRSRNNRTSCVRSAKSHPTTSQRRRCNPQSNPCVGVFLITISASFGLLYHILQPPRALF